MRTDNVTHVHTHARMQSYTERGIARDVVNVYVNSPKIVNLYKRKHFATKETHFAVQTEVT